MAADCRNAISSMRNVIIRRSVNSRHVLLLAGLLLPLCFGQAASAGEEPPVTAKIVGLGATSCLQFTNDVKQNPAVQRDYLAWAQGFMSSILLSRPSVSAVLVPPFSECLDGGLCDL